MTAAAVAIVGVFGALALLVAARGGRRGATAWLTVDAEGARRELLDGRREEVCWDEVTEVDVFTTSIGPHRRAGGAVVLYGDEQRGCVVPLDRLVDSGLLDQVGRLPGFDHRRLVAALQEGDGPSGPFSVAAITGPGRARRLPRTTVCWRRDDAPPASPIDAQA